MNSPYLSKFAILMLAIPLYAVSLFTVSPAAAAGRHAKPAVQVDSAEAQALAITEMKLAALAKEANKETAPAAAEVKKMTHGRKSGGAKRAGAHKKGVAESVVAGAVENAVGQNMLALNTASDDPALAHNLDSMQEAVAPAEPGQKSPGKKAKKGVRKKRSAKSRAGVVAKADPDKKLQNVVDRRLSRAEVLKVLSTTRDFTGSDLSGMNLVGIDFSGVKFNRAKLHMANLERADLAESDLELADLTGANLRGASLNQARLRGARLADSHMDGALWVDRTVCKKGSIGGCIE
jgi:hypothetical protein